MAGPYAPETVIAARIRTRRISAGWTQAEMAARTGVSRSRLSDIENKRGELKFAEVVRIATALDCSLDELGQRGKLF